MLTALAFVAGLVGLFLGGDWLVRGASGLAARLGLSPMVIGLTVVGFGTSMPELLVSVRAALAGSPAIAIGNVIGSNTANILLILGVSALAGPLAAPFVRVSRDLAWMLGAAFLTVPVFWSGMVGRIEGLILVAGIVTYLVLALRRGGETPTVLPAGAPTAGRSALIAVTGLGGLLLGAHLLVGSATEIARALGVSEAAIGLTIVAVGTSLPELATSVAAAIKGQRDIALGNVIGSNIFNILAILGLTALVAPIPADPRFLVLDVPVMIAASAALAGLLFWKQQIGRLAGLALLAAYAAYLATMATS